MVKTAFRERFLAEEVTFQAVFLIPKEGGDYCGIGHIEVVGKAVAVILNSRFTASITYHDSLCGFQASCGTGTATLEVRLLQQVTTMREAVLHAIFLDLKNSYDALDRSSCLDIMEVYGVSPRSLRLLCRYW